MAAFTNEEMAQMHFLYGLANGNSLEARRLYAERYPERRLPCSETFTRLHIRLQETGTFARSKNIPGRPLSVRTAELEEQILDVVEDSPGISTRKIAADMNISGKTVWKILKENLLYPYHIQRVQALLPNDFPARVNWCQWFQQMVTQNPNFSSTILFTDEAQFTRQAIINFHNNHLWAQENPHGLIEARHQHTFSVNVWAGIVEDNLIGPYFLPHRLDGNSYYHFITNVLPELLEDLPLMLRRRMWFMHDGAPPHFALIVREFLNNRFANRWIGRGGPQHWPPRSPDINPLDFFFWGYLKSLVYTTPIETVDELRNRIEQACDIIRNTPEIFQRVRESLRRRVESCIMANGGHFQQFI